MPFWAYMLRLRDWSSYTGHTDDLERRFAEHQSGAMPGYTSLRRPVELVWCQEFPDRDQAKEAGYRIKRWSRAKKEALIAGDWKRVSELAKKKSR